MTYLWIDVPEHWTEKEEKRFLSKIVKLDNGCLLWTGARAKSKSGIPKYAIFDIDGKTRVLHKYLYEHIIGPVPDNLQLDHLCREMGCVNVLHLEPITLYENNVVRGTGLTAQNAKKTCCPKGHKYSGVNSQGKRICKDCQREAVQRYRLKYKLG